jgi:hypothetical protein
VNLWYCQLTICVTVQCGKHWTASFPDSKRTRSIRAATQIPVSSSHSTVPVSSPAHCESSLSSLRTFFTTQPKFRSTRQTPSVSLAAPIHSPLQVSHFSNCPFSSFQTLAANRSSRFISLFVYLTTLHIATYRDQDGTGTGWYRDRDGTGAKLTGSNPGRAKRTFSSSFIVFVTVHCFCYCSLFLLLVQCSCYCSLFLLLFIVLVTCLMFLLLLLVHFSCYLFNVLVIVIVSCSLFLLLVHCSCYLFNVLVTVHCSCYLFNVLVIVHCSCYCTLFLLLVQCSCCCSFLLLLVHCSC